MCSANTRKAALARGSFDRVVAIKISNGKIATFDFTNSIKESLATAGSDELSWGLSDTAVDGLDRLELGVDR